MPNSSSFKEDLLGHLIRGKITQNFIIVLVTLISDIKNGHRWLFNYMCNRCRWLFSYRCNGVSCCSRNLLGKCFKLAHVTDPTETRSSLRISPNT